MRICVCFWLNLRNISVVILIFFSVFKTTEVAERLLAINIKISWFRNIKLQVLSLFRFSNFMWSWTLVALLGFQIAIFAGLNAIRFCSVVSGGHDGKSVLFGSFDGTVVGVSELSELLDWGFVSVVGVGVLQIIWDLLVLVRFSIFERSLCSCKLGLIFFSFNIFGVVWKAVGLDRLLTSSWIPLLGTLQETLFCWRSEKVGLALSERFVFVVSDIGLL